MGQIAKIQAMLQNGEISCVELTKKYLKAIEDANGELNAYVTVTPDEALETAKKVDEKIARGEKLLPLEGVPMTLSRTTFPQTELKPPVAVKFFRATSLSTTQRCGKF